MADRNDKPSARFMSGTAGLALLGALTGVLLGVAGYISERKNEARTPLVRLVEVDEDTTDPAKWGVNWPQHYDSNQRTA